MKSSLNRRSALGVMAVGLVAVPASAVRPIKRADGFYRSTLLDVYADAWRRKDLNAILSCMDANLTFKAPNASTHGIQAYRAATERFLALTKSVDVRAHMLAGDQAMLAYDFSCIAPIGVSAVAELITFQGSKIGTSEIFFDTAPFKAFAEANKAAASSGR